MNSNVIALISRIREGANNLIVSRLKEAGIKDLSPSHGDILAYLFNFKRVSMYDIARNIHRTKATTTVLIDKLEKIGLVIRVKSAEDSRCTEVFLTDEGMKFKPVFDKISQKLNETIFEGFKDKEKKVLEYLLEKMRRNL